MKKSSPSVPELRETASVTANSSLDLEFPVASDFDSRPPRLTPTEFVAWCEEMMELLPVNRDKPERRLEVHSEFVF